MKNFCKIFIFITILCFAKNVFASIEITEVMYDVSGTDTNREWIEVHNNGSENVDLSKWFVFSDNTKHTITPVSSAILGAGSYAVIVQNTEKFLLDNPSFSGALFDTSWNGLSNEGDSIALKDPELNLTSSVNYTSSMGANGDGNSLQKIGGVFTSSVPTPGSANSKSATPVDDGLTSTESSSNSSAATYKPKVNVPETQKSITTKIIVKNIVTTRVGFPIDATTIGYNKEKLDSGKFVWSFGDGMSYEEGWHKPFEYSYQYAGVYVLTLSYYESILSSKPVATDSITITVLDPELFITKVGDINDAYVEIKNQSEYKMSLSGWTIGSSTKIFRLPEGMAILPGKSVIVSSKVTLFTLSDVQHLSLFAPNQTLVSTYPVSKPAQVIQTVSKNNYQNEYYAPVAKKPNQDSAVDLNSITASTASSSIPRNFLPFIGLFGIVLIGIVALVFAHKKSSSGGEEIGGISASDIRIIE